MKGSTMSADFFATSSGTIATRGDIVAMRYLKARAQMIVTDGEMPHLPMFAATGGEVPPAAVPVVMQ